jgi:CRP/FNR family cyclic AMP-dependent transcriptional regulator
MILLFFDRSKVMTKSLVLCEIEQAEIVHMLENMAWSHDFNSIQIEKLAPYFKLFRTDSDVIILSEGEMNPYFYLLCEGEVNITKENGAAEVKNFRTLGAGKIFGELSFFDNGPCSASIVSKTAIKLLAIHKKDFQKLCAELPGIALVITLNLIKTLSQRTRETTGKLIDFL